MRTESLRSLPTTSKRRFVVDTNVLVSRLRQGVARCIVVLHRVTVCRDPRDDKCLDFALNGDAECIVSGDKNRLALDPFPDLRVLSSDAFVTTERG